MKQKRRGPLAATLGNFVVKVALRITDARQEVGTAEAARGSRHGGREGQEGGRGRRCIVGVSGRTKWKKRHYSIMRTYGALVTHLHGCYYSPWPPSLPLLSLPLFNRPIARNVGAVWYPPCVRLTVLLKICNICCPAASMCVILSIEAYDGMRVSS